MSVSHANNEDAATAMNHSQEMKVNVYKSQVVLDREFFDSLKLEKVAAMMHHCQQTQATVWGNSPYLRTKT